MENKNSLNSSEHTLDLKHKLQQQSILRHVKSLDWDKGSDSPLVVEFDPTTACNLACPDCISGSLLNQGGFSNSRIKELVKEMVDAGVKAVILIGGGEPLAHPEIGWVIDYLWTNKVQIGLTTNGLLMDRHMDLIAKCMSWTRVSMDAGLSETFGRIRPNRSGKSEFDKAVANMRRLSQIKKGKLGYSFMIYSEGQFQPNPASSNTTQKADLPYSNVDEIFVAAQLAKDIGCDYFELKPMYNKHHFAIVQNHELMQIAKDQLARALALEDKKFRILRATKLGAVLNHEGDLEPKEYTRCAVSQLRTVISPSGAYVCPYFRGRPDKRIGDVNKMSFKDMWRGAKRKEVLEKLDPSVDCRMHCIRHESNMLLEDMLAGRLTLNPVDDYDFFI